MSARKEGEMLQGSLGRKLRLLRAERGLTMAKAAEGIGITRESLSLLEKNRRNISMPTLSKAAKFYDIPVEELYDLLEDEEEAAPKGEEPKVSALAELRRLYREGKLELSFSSGGDSEVESLALLEPEHWPEWAEPAAESLLRELGDEGEEVSVPFATLPTRSGSVNVRVHGKRLNGTRA